MANSYKILGQAAASSGTLVATGGGSKVISTIVVANTSDASYNFYIYACKNGAAPNMNVNAVVPGTVITGKNTIVLTLGMAIESVDSIALSSNGTTNLTYTAFGVEIT
jgi:hypothetical protein